ncbi:MAG TPA: hypothetical protein VGN88_08340 [Phycisphaerae bacterium]|jgi:hypothetical protein
MKKALENQAAGGEMDRLMEWMRKNRKRHRSTTQQHVNRIQSDRA